MQNSNDVKSIKSLINLLRIPEFAAWTYLAATTGAFIYFLAYPNIPEEILEYKGWVILFFLLIGWLLIDCGNGVFIKRYHKQQVIEQKNGIETKTIEQDAKNKGFKSVAFIVLIRVGVSVLATLLIAPTMSKNANGENGAKEVIKQIGKLSDNRTDQIKIAQKQYNELKANQKARITKETKLAKKEFTTIYKSGDQWQRASYDKEKYSWLLSKANRNDIPDVKYGKALKKAEEKISSVADTEKAKTIAASNALAILQNPDNYNKTVGDLTSLAKEVNGDHKADVWFWTKYLYIIDLGVLILGVFLTLTISNLEVSVGELYPSNPIAFFSKIKFPKIKLPKVNNPFVPKGPSKQPSIGFKKKERQEDFM